MGHTSFQFDRRTLLKSGLASAGALALGPAFYTRAFATGPVQVGRSPYGPLQAFDANGIALPKGFRSREIARGGELVRGAFPPYAYHYGTDGQATFPTLGAGGGPDGGWILVANSEVPIPGGGGVSGFEFSRDGEVKRAYRVLAGTTSNCAGGPTPWGTWLSCEEYDGGRVWECDPTGREPGVVRPAMGVFAHEAVCVDPRHEKLYLTEDEGDGCFYRFTPAEYPDLSAGRLEVAVREGSRLRWVRVPDPSAGGGPANPTRRQVRNAARFDGGEGTWFDDGIVYFTTKGENRVYAYDTRTSRLKVLYDKEKLGPKAPLKGVDNITVSPSGDIYVCEDGGDLDICIITPGFEVARFCKLHPRIHDGPSEPNPLKGNETVGVVFDPKGERMYFGAQRSFPQARGVPSGVVYEVRGPFRKTAPARFGDFSVDVGRRIGVRRYLRGGLPLRVSLDQAAGVRAALTVRHRTRSGRIRRMRIGRVKTPTAVNGRVALTARPTRNARRALRGRRRVRAELKIVATSAGKTHSRRREVMIVNPRPRRPL